jgi:hypothetical protein
MLVQRYNSLIEGSATQMDIVLFLTWVALLITPFFQEINLLGIIGLKQEIESVRSDVKEQILNLKTEIQNQISIQTQFTPQIVLPPPDAQLPNLENRLRTVLTETLGIQREEVRAIPDVSEDVMYLMNVRHVIEREMKRIWAGRFPKGDRYWAFSSILRLLSNANVIGEQFAKIIREVYSICSAAVHADDVSEAQLIFIKENAPELMTLLRKLD